MHTSCKISTFDTDCARTSITNSLHWHAPNRAKFASTRVANVSPCEHSHRIHCSSVSTHDQFAARNDPRSATQTAAHPPAAPTSVKNCKVGLDCKQWSSWSADCGTKWKSSSAVANSRDCKRDDKESSLFGEVAAISNDSFAFAVDTGVGLEAQKVSTQGYTSPDICAHLIQSFRGYGCMQS